MKGNTDATAEQRGEPEEGAPTLLTYHAADGGNHTDSVAAQRKSPQGVSAHSRRRWSGCYLLLIVAGHCRYSSCCHSCRLERRLGCRRKCSYLDGVCRRRDRPLQLQVVRVGRCAVEPWAGLEPRPVVGVDAPGSWKCTRFKCGCETRGPAPILMPGDLLVPTLRQPRPASWSPALLPNLDMPKPAGTPVRWKATVAGASVAPMFKFWIYDKASWALGQDWSAADTWSWIPPTAGNYLVQVWVRNPGSWPHSMRGWGTGRTFVTAPTALIFPANSLLSDQYFRYQPELRCSGPPGPSAAPGRTRTSSSYTTVRPGALGRIGVRQTPGRGSHLCRALTLFKCGLGTPTDPVPTMRGEALSLLRSAPPLLFR